MAAQFGILRMASMNNPSNTRSIEDRIPEVVVPWPAMVAAGPFMLWGLIHAGATRPLDDFVRIPLYFVLPFTALLWAAIAYEAWRSSASRKDRGALLGIAILVPITMYFAAAVVYALGASIKDAYVWLQSSPGLTRTQAVAVGVAGTLVLGSILFYFRLRLRATYGLTEAMVGLTVAGYRVHTDLGTPNLDHNSFYLTMLTAGVYLVVRGFDNIDQGLHKDPKDPVATRLLARIRGVSTPTPGAPATSVPSPGPVRP